MRFSEFSYVRPNIEKVQLEMSVLISKFKDAASAEEQVAVIGEINEVRKEFETAQTIAHIRHTLDTTDSFYEEEFSFFNEHGPLYEEVDSQFYQALLDSSFRTELERQFGSQLFRVAESKVRTFSPEVLDLLAEENRLTAEYRKLIATAKIIFNGTLCTFPQVDKFLSDRDRGVRKQATKSKYQFFADNEEKLDELFDMLVKVRDKIAKTLGFANFIELAYLRWNRTGWDADSAQAFRSHILKHIVPICSQLIESQRHRLGIEKVRFYDERLTFPTGNPTPKGDPEWIVEQGRKLYSELSSETKDFYMEMTERELFDLVNKNGKAYVGYCTYIWKERAPFVFANFNGTSNDIRVLVHEVGHAFQAYQSLKEQQLPEYFFPTMEASEIFSMSMEFFVFPWAELFFQEDSEKHRFSHLHDSLVKLPRMCLGDEFQHEVYANPHLTPKERKQLWSRLEKKYLPERNYDEIEFLQEGGQWQEIIHLYEVPFYFIDYALAQVCALEFWRLSTVDWQDAWNKYLHLARVGGSRSFDELLEAGNLKSPFEEHTLVDLKIFLEEKLMESIKI
jgi:M3 family oligoendopeptidase